MRSHDTNNFHMVSVSVILGIVLLCACGKSSVVNPASRETPNARPLQTSEIVSGEVLVKFKSETTKERIAAILAQMRAEIITTFEGLGVYHLRIVSGEPVETVVQKFSHLPEVEYAEPNYIRKRLQRGQ